MLQIQNIKKQYKTGYLIQQALDNVSLSFRDSEFVSILGPSGSGKTTLLNIIGGLDQYDSGELMINGISTKKYRDKDWDSYRNHTVGFVFQSYNLIPHQSILANVELALTISGISRRERRQRAEQVLTQVGLGDQLHKRPNQMSGGQMQRVAIARALVNNPSILLADEPTGALDTATSLQIMELLREVSKERLVVMVTHNSELAERYSTRIVKLQDGRITDDSAPYTPEVGELPTPKYQSMGRAKMSLLTALSLSFNNLRTKKGRTLLTSMAVFAVFTVICVVAIPITNYFAPMINVALNAETQRIIPDPDAQMVIKNYNHPSVVMNSIGNEISELAIPEGQEYCKKLAVLARELDPGKAVTLGVNLMLCSMSAKGGGIYGDKKDGKENKNGSQTMDNVPTSAFFNMLMNMAGGMIEKMAAKPAADNATKVCFSYLDIGGYNYAASRYEKDGTLHPDRVIVGSETLPKNLYHNWQLVKKLPYVIGDFMWTGWDYLGESGIGTVRYKSFKNPGQDAPIISGGCGVIDICGKLRPEVQWNRLTWGLDHTPGIGVEPYTHAGETGSVSMWRDTDAVASWSWAGCEGKRNKITVYSDGDTAELIINGHSYGKKKTKEYKAVFKHIAYEPGTITAISYDSAGKELSRTSMKTAEGASELRVAADRSTLKAGTQDLAYLSIDLTGADGITKSSEDTAVTVEVSGAGELLALGSAKPNMGENFFSNTHTTYYGKALAVVRAGDAPGGITVTVRADGMQARTVELNAI